MANINAAIHEHTRIPLPSFPRTPMSPQHVILERIEEPPTRPAPTSYRLSAAGRNPGARRGYPPPNRRPCATLRPPNLSFRAQPRNPSRSYIVPIISNRPTPSSPIDQHHHLQPTNTIISNRPTPSSPTDQPHHPQPTHHPSSPTNPPPVIPDPDRGSPLSPKPNGEDARPFVLPRSQRALTRGEDHLDASWRCPPLRADQIG